MAKLDEKPNIQSTLIDKGVFVTTVTIVRVEDLSVHPRWKDRTEKEFKTGKPIELYLKVTYDAGEWEKGLYLTGSYKIDKVTGKITGWKYKNNGVQNFLVTILGKETVEEYLYDDYAINPKLLDLLVGRSFQKISYVSGTYTNKNGEEALNFRDWKKVFPVTASIDEIKEEWNNAVQYIKTYTPDLIDSNVEFRYGANANNNDEDVI